MVNLTRIYTRTGDDGTTALGDMSRVGKNDLRLQAYADTDEANSSLGVALALGDLDADVVTLLGRVQNDLFDVGADLCTPVVPDPKYPPLRVAPSRTTSQPRRRSSSAMYSTSRMSGTSCSTVVPSASSAAAMSLRTLFFAPVTRTSPASRAPPTIRKASTGPEDRRRCGVIRPSRRAGRPAARPSRTP